jgi:hypothetical protein
MTLEERRAWSRLVAAVAAYGGYVAVVLERAGGRPLTGVPYAAALLWSIAASIAGAGAAMLMAMAGWERFWIANVIYLCFAASAVLGNVTKVVVYRGSFPQW